MLRRIKRLALTAWLTAAAGALGQPAVLQGPRTGDHRESYALAPAGGAFMTYRIYVPSTWKPSVKLPLVVLLHGYRQTPDAMFDGAPQPREVQALAEGHGFIVVAPQGYDLTSDYGANLPLPHALPTAVGSPERRAASALAEEDVLQTRDRVLAEYGADPHRVYLMGNSMGMTGVLNLAKDHPGLWCAIGPSDGPPWPGFPVGRLHHLSGAVVVNGDKDQVASSAVNRALAERMEQAGLDARFVEAPGGVHETAWFVALPQTFAFFAQHPC